MRLSYGGNNLSERIRLANEIDRRFDLISKHLGFIPPKDILDLVFLGNKIRYDGLHALRRLWGLSCYAEWLSSLYESATSKTPKE